jgi:phosphoglycolate phosphatase
LTTQKVVVPAVGAGVANRVLHVETGEHAQPDLSGLTTRYATAVFDLDNTFYDWVAVFATTTQCLVDSLSAESGLARHELELEIRHVFASAGSLEHTFLIQELPSLRRLHPQDSPMQLVARYEATIQAVKSARRCALVPYSGVVDGLRHLHRKGVQLAALTSAPRFAANQRLRSLGLTDLFDLVAASPDAPVPAHTELSILRAHPESHYASRVTELDVANLRKPDSRLLGAVLDALDARHERTVMVGDDVSSDIGMAFAAGVDAIWARYGVRHRPEDREVLLRFTPWTPRQAARQHEFTPEEAGFPTVAWANSFTEVVDLLLDEQPCR